ncbi:MULTISPECIES: MarR family winged helix-turn-helix transcriptional regulator [Bacillus]|uniref:Transcriptional regulator MarR family / Acetyltransferase (GNAT) n=3 Tax=Bacillus cereus group TaxID=86661 RepID=A0A164MLN9_BACCE|nr:MULTISPECIES: MarR family winged helix-turn-helix transcriptional regulator [Bacillus]KZD60856.1 Transcriptional regulator MarR family / Acetyltransferase (GNAT) [Bacillus cereus]MCU5197341.1 MarR family winged helix-turn-helix transcriptional regulator [Bacillus mobilis]MDG1622594.1 MarR family winged helix-turn-helix transcriptional regulator [Bacillus mobilis]MDX5837482.1 MarR family winged helix-turn-helix transcriptional regulator [Bacillus cereus group sp. BfR-BA-01700]MED4383690.1 Ma
MDKKIIYDIRQFNRFYTKVLGLFNNQILDTDYSLTETRILFEISERTECIANNLVQELNIDRSYMSRILRRFEKEELIEKRSSLKDSRKNLLFLTKKGEELLDIIHIQSDEQINQLFNGLSDSEINEIRISMMIIKEKLNKNIKQK